jgi:hypothetical protein
VVFHAIRLVARDPNVSISTQGFFLRLIPLVDSATLKSDWSIQRVAEALGLSVASVKRYRAELLRVGAIEKRSGWYVVDAKPEQGDSIKSDTLVSDLIPEQGDSIRSDTSKVSDLIPYNNYRSTSLTTSLAAAATRARDDFLPSRFLPKFGDRRPTQKFDQDDWSRRWKNRTGDEWIYPEWTERVCPYLDAEEVAELFLVLIGKGRPSLGFATAVVNRLITGRVRAVNTDRVPVDDGEFSQCLE